MGELIIDLLSWLFSEILWGCAELVFNRVSQSVLLAALLVAVFGGILFVKNSGFLV